VDDVVERGPGVHRVEHVGHELLEHGGDLVEHPLDPVGVGDGQAVGGHEQLGRVAAIARRAVAHSSG
jgi:hypothetical protein